MWVEGGWKENRQRGMKAFRRQKERKEGVPRIDRKKKRKNIRGRKKKKHLGPQKETKKKQNRRIRNISQSTDPNKQQQLP